MEIVTGEYVKSLIYSVPFAFYEGAISIFIFCLVTFVAIWGIKRGLRYSSIVALTEYVVYIYCSTIIFRPSLVKRMYDFHLFWSYSTTINGTGSHLEQIVMNVVFFIPLGFLFRASFKSISLWKVILGAFLISTSIEILQFIYRKGFSEIDDIINNVLGSMLGYGIFKSLYFFLRRKKSRLFLEEKI